MTTMFDYLKQKAEPVIQKVQGMLVLARERSEVIRLEIPPSDQPREFFVKVVRIKNGQARLGFYGPREIEVMRDELPRRLEAFTVPPVAEAVAA